VKESLGWIEAKLEEEILRDNYSLIIGKVVCAEINEAYISEGNLQESPVVILFPFFKKLGDKVGSRDEFES
jgi:flavin reductase (DIM6/NTAB) family NADH-FMN oxidoreductase RutF